MSTRLALTGRHQWLRPALIVAALAAALAAYLLLAAPAAGRHRETLAAATAARNTAHGAAWDARQAAADAAARERDQILRDGQAASAAYADEWREKVAKARAPHDKAAAAALEQNAADRVLAEQARAKPGQTGWDVEKVPEVVEQEAGEKRTKVLNDCMASSGGSIFAGTDPACVKKADAAAEKHRATKDARIKAASAEHAKAIKAVEAAEAAQLKSYREWEAATAAADAAEAKVTGAGDPIVNAEKRAQKTYTDGVAAADAALADAKASADAELADAQGRADLLRSVSTGAGLALAGAGVVAAAVLAWPFLTRGGQRVAQNERARRVPLTAAGIVRRFIDWETTGVIRFLAWRRQGKAGDPLQRTIRDALMRDLESGRMTSAEALKAHAQAGGGQALTGERNAARGAAYVLGASAVIWLAQILLKLGGFVAAAAPGTVAESGVQSTVTLVAHLAPVSWIAAAAVAGALGIAAVGHAVTLDAPLPAVPVAGAAPAVDVDPHADTLARSLKDSDRRAWGHLLTPAVVVPIDGGHQYTWKLPPGLPASEVNQARLMSNASALGEHPRLVECSGQRVVLDVLDVDPDNMPPTPWPAPARSNFRDPFPVGKTSSGQSVAVWLAGARVAVIAKSGHGKSYLARSIATWAAQDENVDLRVADLKGDAKLAPLRQCASAWASARDLEAAWDMICAVGEEVDRRNVWSGSDPEGREAIDHFGPLVLFVDEVDRVVGTRAEKALGDIAERGRSAGITMVVATRQTDSKSVPTNVLNACETKFVGRFDKGSFVWSMMGVPADVDLSTLRLGEWAVADLAWSGWRIVRSYLLDDGPARERLAAAAEVRARHMPVVAQDVLPAAEPDPLDVLLEKMGDRSGMTMGEVREAIGDEAAEAVRKVTGSDKFRRGEATLRGVRRKDLEAAVNAGT